MIVRSKIPISTAPLMFCQTVRCAAADGAGNEAISRLLQTNEDPVLKAGLAHYWFVAIHPFDEGNGRIGRAITDMALARSDHTNKRYYSLSASIKSKANDYYSVLEKTSNGTLDITAWQTFFIDRVSQSIDLAQIALDRVITKARFWEENRSKGLSER